MEDSKINTLLFSDAPGSQERHLIRKYDNPLFGAIKELTQTDIDNARQNDIDEYQSFLEDFNHLLKEVSILTGAVETEIILEMKERIDTLYERCVSFGVEQSEYKTALQKLHHTIMNAIRQAAKADSMVIKELEREQEVRKLHIELMEYKLVSDLLRSDSPIKDNELVPTLLSEDAEAVQVVMSLFEPKQQQAIRNEAKTLLERLAVNNLPEDVQKAYEAMISQKQ
ncbi:hypothetical protein MNBD_GAMMA12-552 [hydrothermal vent metagenome]|uniref:Uncharacterized protein n=1 Tax=hydrothermal vent metagenome TaxID=652676 RepID=A0A3B0Y8N4_9ZZZZ